MNPCLTELQPYPFEKLAQLKAGAQPPAGLKPINLSIGEPKHPTPELILRAVCQSLGGLASYPATKGTDELRQAIAAWLRHRFGLPTVDAASHVLPVNGSREALFAFAQCVIKPSPDALVLMPNPFYQIYEGAALLAGARPWYVNSSAASGWLPDFSSVAPEVWQRCQLLYICSPSNPSGAVMSQQDLQRLICLADEHNFVIASDECYSELYQDEANPPPGLLQAAAAMGRTDYRRCVVFHSLSKRSSAPGLRSGFVAGDADILKAFLLYRTYHGCAMSPMIQSASVAAWQDESHVRENRRLYREKFTLVRDILAPALEVEIPPGGFYLWLQTPIDDAQFSRELFEHEHVTVLPGSYLSRPAHGVNPGARRVRIALVAGVDECIEAARRLRQFVDDLA